MLIVYFDIEMMLIGSVQLHIVKRQNSYRLCFNTSINAIVTDTL